MTLGEKIYILRQQKCVSQETMALDLNVSRQAISKWETDQSITDLDKIKLLSSYFKVSIDDLVNSEELVKSSIAQENKTENNDNIKKERIDETNGINMDTLLNINKAKRLSSILIKAAIALTIFNYIITILMIIFQKHIILILYSREYKGFVFPYAHIIYNTISTAFLIFSGFTILKKMKTLVEKKSILQIKMKKESKNLTLF